MADFIRFAIVGYGRIGRRYSELIESNPKASLVAVADIATELKSQIRAGIRFYTCIEDLLAYQEELDVVVVATPNGLHALHAELTLLAGKHVVVEKPMTIKSTDAQRLIELSKNLNQKVFVVMQNRYSPPAQWLKKSITEQKLGEVFWIEMNCYWNRDSQYYQQSHWHGTKELDGGTLFTQFSHFIDMLYWVFGEIVPTSASFFNFTHQDQIEIEDTGVVSFQFGRRGKGIFTFSTSTYKQNLESSLTILGEKGTIKVGGQYMEKVEHCEIQDYTFETLPATALGNDYGTWKGSAANHHFVVQNVIDALSSGTPVATTVEEGAAVVRIIENMYQTSSNYPSEGIF